MSHLELRGNKYMSNYLNDSFAALRMVQRTVNNVIVVRLQYNHCIVSVIWSELSSDNIMVSTVSTAASISSTPITSLEYLRSSHCRNMENVLFTQASHSSMQNLRCMYKIIYACMIMIIYELSPRRQGCRRTPPCCPGQP